MVGSSVGLKTSTRIFSVIAFRIEQETLHCVTAHACSIWYSDPHRSRLDYSAYILLRQGLAQFRLAFDSMYSIQPTTGPGYTSTWRNTYIVCRLCRYAVVGYQTGYIVGVKKACLGLVPCRLCNLDDVAGGHAPPLQGLHHTNGY